MKQRMLLGLHVLFFFNSETLSMRMKPGSLARIIMMIDRNLERWLSASYLLEFNCPIVF